MRTGAMNRVFVLVFVGCCAAGVAWLMIHDHDESGHAAAAPDAGAGGDGGGDGAPKAPAVGGGDVGGSGIGGAPPDLDLGAGGADAPALTDAPKSVNFGVIMVQYSGAEGAKPGTRSRAEAKKLAEELVTLAQDDFEAAVKKGDPGSVVDAGRMFRGILEPAAEYSLFSLEEGQVSDPVDTPRGFWIVKRRK
jgi:parvulin-like peptidyl-prolyl isomerase